MIHSCPVYYLYYPLWLSSSFILAQVAIFDRVKFNYWWRMIANWKLKPMPLSPTSPRDSVVGKFLKAVHSMNSRKWNINLIESKREKWWCESVTSTHKQHKTYKRTGYQWVSTHPGVSSSTSSQMQEHGAHSSHCCRSSPVHQIWWCLWWLMINDLDTTSRQWCLMISQFLPSRPKSSLAIIGWIDASTKARPAISTLFIVILSMTCF